MSTATEGSLKVNGFTIDEGLKELIEAYRLQNEKSDTVVKPEDHPILQRQNRITPKIKGLDGIVKKHLGDAPRFDTDKDYKKADAILNELAYALAQTEKYQGKLEDFKDEDARRYLGIAATNTNNPIFNNKTALISSILDLAFANPDNEQYDKNSPLAQLIGYIAVQQDESSKKTTYEKQVFAEKWNRLGEDGKAIPRQFTAKTGIELKPYATANDAFADLERVGTYEAQGLALKLPKTHRPAIKAQEPQMRYTA